MPAETRPRLFRTPVAPPAVPGLVFRHFSGPADYPGMNDAANDSRIAGCYESMGFHPLNRNTTYRRPLD